jgi:hypothetical protein
MSRLDEDMRTLPTEDTGQEARVDRRTWLTSAVSLVGATATGLITPALPSSAEGEGPDPTRVPGRGPSPYGIRAQGETTQHLTMATHSPCCLSVRSPEPAGMAERPTIERTESIDYDSEYLFGRSSHTESGHYVITTLTYRSVPISWNYSDVRYHHYIA